MLFIFLMGLEQFFVHCHHCAKIICPFQFTSHSTGSNHKIVLHICLYRIHILLQYNVNVLECQGNKMNVKSYEKSFC